MAEGMNRTVAWGPGAGADFTGEESIFIGPDAGKGVIEGRRHIDITDFDAALVIVQIGARVLASRLYDQCSARQLEKFITLQVKRYELTHVVDPTDAVVQSDGDGNLVITKEPG